MDLVGIVGEIEELRGAFIDALDVLPVPLQNASLGEMVNQLADLGIRVPDGVAVTAAGYRRYLDANGLTPLIQSVLEGLDLDEVTGLKTRGAAIRAAFLAGAIPDDLAAEIYRIAHQPGSAQSFYVELRPLCEPW